MSTVSILDHYDAILQDCEPAFVQHRTHQLWMLLILGWVLTVAQRKLTRMLPLADPDGEHAHDAFHRLLRVGAWSLTKLFQCLARHVVGLLPEDAVIPLVADDTLARHVGPRVAGAGWYRDPVRSTGTKTVHAHGLSLVILAVRLQPPWGSPPVALPIHLGVHAKDGDATYVDILAELIQDVRGWFPTRRFSLVADGAYASYAAHADDVVAVTSRLRQDAKIYALPTPNPPGKRGPKPKKGVLLPKPRDLARDPTLDWQEVEVRRGHRTLTRQVHSRSIIWQAVRPNTPIQLFIVRDPTGIEADDFFFTTTLDRPASRVVTEYGDRWPIEVTIRDSKQVLGLEEPQCWKDEGPRRAAGVGLWLFTLVWLLYLTAAPATPVESPPWYRHKRAPSFADALAAVRTALWARKLGTLSSASLPAAISHLLIACLARAA
jgi:hypothetical protein